MHPSQSVHWEHPKPVWIALLVLTFLISWPLGLALLAILFLTGRLEGWKRAATALWHEGIEPMREARAVDELGCAGGGAADRHPAVPAAAAALARTQLHDHHAADRAAGGLFVRTRQELLHSRGYDVTVRKAGLQPMFGSGRRADQHRASSIPSCCATCPGADLVQATLHDLMERSLNPIAARRQQEQSRPPDETTVLGVADPQPDYGRGVRISVIGCGYLGAVHAAAWPRSATTSSASTSTDEDRRCSRGPGAVLRARLTEILAEGIASRPAALHDRHGRGAGAERALRRRRHAAAEATATPPT